MTDDPVHVVTLRMRSGTVPNGGAGAAPGVEGVVELDDGTARPFSGWIDLLDHLESIVEVEAGLAEHQEDEAWQ